MFLNSLALEGRSPVDRHGITKQLIQILKSLARAGLGHSGLRLGSFAIREGRVYLAEVEGLHRSGLLLDDLLLLSLDAARYATVTDFQRGWNQLGPGGRMPGLNRRGPSMWRGEARRAFNDPARFGRMLVPDSTGKWSGVCFRSAALPQRWSGVSQLRISEADWAAAWSELWRRIEQDQLSVLKRGHSGDVLEGAVRLCGMDLAVVVKRPGRGSIRRNITQVFCGSRARQAWEKAWGLVVRGIATAWPMLLMEKRLHGYVTDSLLVMEKVHGPLLAELDAQTASESYRLLLWRCGRVLRQMEQSGLFLYDAKAYNWIVRDDASLGPTPVLIDADSVRRMHVRIGGLNRLLRSLREDTPAGLSAENALALVRGYRPFASSAELNQLAGLEG